MRLAKVKFQGASRDEFRSLAFGAIVIIVAGLIIHNYQLTSSKLELGQKLIQVQKELRQATTELERLKREDQYVRNNQLEADIKNIQKTYQLAVNTYENLLKLKEISQQSDIFDASFSDALTQLSQRSWATAGSTLTSLNQKIEARQQKIIASFTIPANVPSENLPPQGGYRRQRVTTDVGEFLVDIVSADLGSTRVIVDTASDGTCLDNCPTLPLSEYVGRNGAFTGVNGSYFCPAEYPSCAGKKNSFDTLLMNKNKVYFNSDNNVYSTVPAVIFGNGWIRFVGRSLDWGRDTSIDSMIANQPLLISDGNVVFGGDEDPKKGSKGSRSFVGATGSTVYIGVVHNATVAQSARVLKALGLTNALNLDDGGSTALWSGGYKVGPGRNLPNAILFLRK